MKLNFPLRMQREGGAENMRPSKLTGGLVIFKCFALEKLSFAAQNLPRRVLAPPAIRKDHPQGVVFSYGGDGGARTLDLTDVNRAL